MTEEEKGVLSEAEGILAEALKQELKQYKDTTQEAMVLGEHNAWSHEPLDTVYDLWVFGKTFVGTPEELAEWKKAREADKSTVHVNTSAMDKGTANACIQMTKAFAAKKKMPENINALLADPRPMMMVHEASDVFGEVCGLMIRTQAFASQRSDTRPSEADDKFDVTVSASVLDGQMCLIARRQDSGEMLEEPRFIDVAEWKGDNPQELKDCVSWLEENHGHTAALLYGALYLPIAMKSLDPEMYEAAKQDFLTPVREEGNTPTTGEEQ